VSRSGNTGSWESRSGNVQGSGTRTKTEEGFNVDRTVTTDSGASKTVSKEVNREDQEIQRDATTTNRWGESATRESTVKNEGGYRSIEGKTETSTGREISSDLAVGRTVTGGVHRRTAERSCGIVVIVLADGVVRHPAAHVVV